MENYDNDGQATIVKLTSSGSPVWSKTLRNPEGEYNGYELNIGSLDADADGNIYFIGSYEVPNFVIEPDGSYGNGRAGLLLKMNSNGVVQWSRISGPGDCSDLGAQVAYKAGKLYATYQTERPYYKNDSGNGYVTQQIILACYDAASGQLLWGNNFGPEVLWGYSNPTGNAGNDQDRSTFSGKLIAVHGDYLAVAGQAGLYSRAEDNEIRSYAFLAQLPLAGSEMDLAGWTYKKTRHKSQYAAIESENFSDLDLNNTTDIEVSASDEFTPSNTATNVVIKLLASGANQWDFKPNGDLALPVGGNIEISRAAQGSVNVVGHFGLNNPDGIGNYFNSVTTDADGNQYYVGMWNWHNNNTPIAYNQMPLVVKVNAQGEVEWKSLLGNSYPTDSYDGVEGAARTVAYDPASGHIVVVCNDSGEGNDSQMLIVDIDVNTGKVVEDHRYSSANGIYANGIAINTLGERFITGSIQSPDNIAFTVTNSMIASTATLDTIMVPVEVFGEEEIPNRYRTDGWTLQGVANVNYVDHYVNITGAVQQGSGATFDITINGSGAITGAVVGAGGTNYRTGHKILVDHLEVDGSDNNSDIILTVTSSTNGVIQTVAAGYYGSGGGGQGTWSGTTGTNYQVGSGFAIIVDVDNNTATNNMSVLHSAGGTNYVVGDVITFPGTQFGGTSPETDIVITALQVGGFSGDIQSNEDVGYAVTQRGVSPRTYVRMQFNGADFTNNSTSTYNLLHYREADSFLAKFVSTATTSTNLVWAKVIAKSNYDQGVAVDYDSEGNLYWASDIYDEETVDSNLNYEKRPVVTKMSSTGTVLWSKSYSTDGGEGNVIGLQVDSEDRVFIGMTQGDFNGNEYSTVVKRLEKDGTAQWTTRFLLDGGNGSQGGLALDSDDNAYVTAINYDGNDNVAWTAKLDCMDGKEIWQQEFRHENYDIYHGFNWRSNSIATDGDKYYISGWTNDGNEGNALAAALPADGSANDTVHGPFSVIESTYNNDGGEGTGNLPGYVTRTYTVSTATDQFTLVTDRDTIQSWMESGPTTNYTVYTKSDAGIVFGDGTVQTTSGSGLPQIRHRLVEKEFKLKLSDAGKHHYIRNQDMTVVIPRYSEVQFPVGTMITIVNISSGYVKVAVDKQDDRTTLYCPATDGSEGGDSLYHGFEFEDQGGGNFITLLKVEESYSNGTRWIINGNNAGSF
jgi:hypothetical protein